MAQETLKEDLKAEIAAGRVVIVVGTGVTNAATEGQLVDGYPVWGWGGLLKHGVWTLQQTLGLLNGKNAGILNLQIDSNDIDFMVSAGEGISSRLRGKSSGIYHRWLKDSVGKLKPTKPETVKVLSQLGGLLATLNYDAILEIVLDRKPVSWRDRDRVEDVLRGKIKDAVLHLHGYFDEPESIVLGLLEYERVVKDPHTQAVLRLFTIDRTLLFVGCRGTVSDPNFSRLIQWAKPTLQDSPLCQHQRDSHPRKFTEQGENGTESWRWRRNPRRRLLRRRSSPRPSGVHLALSSNALSSSRQPNAASRGLSGSCCERTGCTPRT